MFGSTVIAVHVDPSSNTAEGSAILVLRHQVVRNKAIISPEGRRRKQSSILMRQLHCDVICGRLNIQLREIPQTK